YLQKQQKDLSSSAFRRLCKAEFLNFLRVREWMDLYRQISRSARLSLRSAASSQKSGSQNTVLKGQNRTFVTPISSVEGAAGIAGGPADAVHKSVLAGLLSHLGVRDDLQDRRAPSDRGRGATQGAARRKPAQEYVGARGTRFALHPGSVLSKRPPEVVMSVELVETSRLFARGNATVDPAWAESLAGPLAKRQLSEPHWRRSQGPP